MRSLKRLIARLSWKSALAMVLLLAVLAELGFLMTRRPGRQFADRDSAEPFEIEQFEIEPSNDMALHPAESIAVDESSVGARSMLAGKQREVSTDDGTRDATPEDDIVAADGKRDGAQQRQPVPEAELKRRFTSATVEVSQRKSDRIGGGTVVAIGSDYFVVLTAAHLIDEGARVAVTVFQQLGDRWTEDVYNAVEVVNMDRGSDLALLQVRSPLPPEVALPIATNVPIVSKAGLAAWGVTWNRLGQPDPSAVTITSRRMATRKGGSTTEYFVLSRPSEPGVSGSGLIDQFGEVIGVASGNSNGDAYYVSGSHFRQFPALMGSKAAPAGGSPLGRD